MLSVINFVEVKIRFDSFIIMEKSFTFSSQNTEPKSFQYFYENQWKICLCSHNMWDHSSVPLHYSVTLDDMGYPLIREVIMKWPFYPLRSG